MDFIGMHLLHKTYGEGTVEALTLGMGGTLVSVPVTGPLGAPVDCVDYPEDSTSDHDGHLYTRKELGAEAGFKDRQRRRAFKNDACNQECTVRQG